MQISTTLATYFPVRLCPSLLKSGRKNVEPNIDLRLVLEIVFSYFQSAKRNQNQTASTPFSLFPLWEVTLLYKEVCKMSILARFDKQQYQAE